MILEIALFVWTIVGLEVAYMFGWLIWDAWGVGDDVKNKD